MAIHAPGNGNSAGDGVSGDGEGSVHTRSHIVQFYDGRAFLHESVASFLADGLAAGQPGVVIARRGNREAVAERLRSRGFAEGEGRLNRVTFLDARQTLSMFMVGGVPDRQRFLSSMGRTIERRLRGDGTIVRAYGEMVDILWRDGNVDAAMRLEELWNELARRQPFSLLCAYSMRNFSEASHADQFSAVCRNHTRVAPCESYATLGEDGERAREVTRLQQQARALETELDRRKLLERTLRDALVERERAEAERERLLAAEQKARADAEESSRLKDEFLAVLSHELRTPLNAILGWAHVVNDPASDEETVRQGLNVIQRNAGLQRHLIDDLLDVSRIVAGKMQVNAEPVDLATVVAASADTIRPAAAAKRIALVVTADAHARWVTGDAGRLQQVVWNLLSNAVKFTPVGGRVELRLDRDESDALVLVRDSGVGIPPDFLPHVFERFRQADTGTTRRHGGLGVGLAVVRYLVEAQGGTVTAESAGPGTGATFKVRLPLRSPPASTLDGPLSPHRAVLTHARILIVDDDRDSRELLSRVLAQAGAVVEGTASAAEAVALASSGRFDLLVGDIGIPEMDGYGLIRAIRQHVHAAVRGLRAIAVTAFAERCHRERALSAGYDAYMPKPVEPDRLVHVVSGLLSRGVAIEGASRAAPSEPCPSLGDAPGTPLRDQGPGADADSAAL